MGGTCVLNISSIPLEDMGYPANLTTEAIGKRTIPSLKAITPVAIGVGAILGIAAFIANRKNEVAQSQKNEGGK